MATILWNPLNIRTVEVSPMYVYSVIPLTKIPRPQPQIVSYFSTENLERGALVLVPLGRRFVTAVVTEKLDARSAKQTIRSSPYALKKIAKVFCATSAVPQSIIQEAVFLSQHYYEPLGLVLSRTLPSSFEKPTRPFLKELSTLPTSSPKNKEGSRTLYIGKAAPLSRYLSADKNVLVVTATQSNGKDSLPFFSSESTPGDRRALWFACARGDVTRVAGTRSAVFLPLHKPATIVIDGENNNSLVSWDQHPKIDSRTAARARAEREGFSLIMRDIVPSVSIWHTAQIKHWTIEKEGSRLAPLSLIDMRVEMARKNTSLLSPALVSALQKTTPSDSVFLFMHRRGFASAIVCRDCGFVVRCARCNLALVQHGTKLLCHHCGLTSPAPHICSSCKGSRLKQLGGGTELIEQEVARVAPHLVVGRVDSDATRDKQKQQEVFEQFRNGKIQVLVGTSMAIKENELPPLRWAGVVMMDGIANIPFYRAAEEAFGVLWRLRVLARERVLVQTYIPELPLFSMARTSSFEPFYESQLTLRKMLGWPPFTSIAQLVFSHRDEEAAKREVLSVKKKLDEQLAHLQAPPEAAILGPSPALGKRERGTYRWYILIKWPLDASGWVADIEKRNRLLSVVPPRWDITVDPIDIP